MPAWFAPPENMLGMPVGLRCLLVQRDDLAVAMVSFVAFPTGLRFDVLLKSRGELGAEEGPFHPFWPPFHRAPRRRGGAGELPGALFRFGVEYADGGRATSLGTPHVGRDEGTPRGPVLMQRGGGGGGGSWSTGY